MTQQEIIDLLAKVTTPIYQIEEKLGMPKTTLQKAIKGERDLPKKWCIKLLDMFIPSENPIKAPDKSVVLSSKKTDQEDVNLDNSMIQDQIKAIKLEKIPPDRNKSHIGRTSWATDQRKRIEELQSQLK